MPREVLSGWMTDPGGKYIDGTFGRGGHSRLLLEKLGAEGELLVMDRDPQAIAEARELQREYPGLRVAHAAFAEMAAVVDGLQWRGKVAGMLLDLGVSSPQLDNPERGFSFMRDGPLDMRMDSSRGESAAAWLAGAGQGEIIRVLREFGEEKYAARIAKAIVEAREQSPIDTTFKLVALIDAAVPNREQGKHRATRTFQALRIQVNRELEQLEVFLGSCVDLLAPGGRLAIISFHSLEDRIVKRFMRSQVKGDAPPARVPVREDQIRRRLKLVGRAQMPGDEEIANNPRSRSAVLRVAEKVA